MRKKSLSVISTIALLTTLLVGCGSQNSEQAQAEVSASDKTVVQSSKDESVEDVITIRSCFTTGMTGAVNNFAIEKGLYRELGIEFENIQADDTQGRLSLMSRGEIDVADGDPSSYIPGINNGVPAKLVGNMWRYSGCYWLIANNDIKSLEDLKGKTIGTAGPSGGMKLSVLKMLEENGISEDDVTFVANGTHQKAYATLTSGEVDATIIHNPYASLAEEEGIGHPLGRAWDYIPDYYTGTIMASNDIIENRPEDLQRFLTAYYKVHEEVKNEYFDEFITWAANQMNVSEDVMRDAVNSEIDVWLDYPVIPEDRLENTLGYLKDYGWIDENTTLEGTYTNEFAQKAADELGMTDPEAK